VAVSGGKRPDTRPEAAGGSTTPDMPTTIAATRAEDFSGNARAITFRKPTWPLYASSRSHRGGPPSKTPVYAARSTRVGIEWGGLARQETEWLVRGPRWLKLRSPLGSFR